MTDFSRRRFLQGSTVAVLAGATFRLPADDSAAPEPFTAPAETGPDGHYQLQYFNDDEMTTIKAAIDRFIPADDLSPSATEVGVPEYIDRQLAGPYGTGARWYMKGPFEEGLPTQGYQSKRPPAELIRDGLRALERHVQASTDAGRFADLAGEHQEELLQGLEEGKVKLDGVDGQLFFNHFLALTKEGFFADPMYGGNRDMAGWKMLGFPGARSNYYEWPEKTGTPYPYGPVSIKGG